MSTTRVRGNSNVVSRGYAKFISTGIPLSGHNGTIKIEQNDCTDVVRTRAEGDCKPLTIFHFKQTGGTLNGKSAAAEFREFYPTVYGQTSTFTHWTGLPGVPSDTLVATNAAARTNPSRPYVDVPRAVGELFEVTQLLKRTGGDIIRRVAAANITGAFGLGPIYSDLQKLCNFAEQLDRRLKEMNRLQSSNGLRKTTQHGTYSKSGPWTRVFQSQGIYYEGTFQTNTVEDVSCHTRWIPEGDFRFLDAASLRILTHDLMLGMKSGRIPIIDLSTIWELIPWTWLLDWAGNVGQYFAAQRNIVPCQFAGAYVMRDVRSVTTHPGAKLGSGLTLEPVHILYETRTRKQGLVAPTAQFPLLNGNQLGIIASLSVLRGR
jgi:hypothetical protein